MAKKSAPSTSDLLAAVRLFKKLDKKQLERLAQAADIVQAPEGRRLITEGALGRELIVIMSGSVEVQRGGNTIATLGPNDTVGELALLDHKEATATVVTTSDCELCVIEGLRFGPLLEEMPGVAIGVLREVASRLREADKAFDVWT